MSYITAVVLKRCMKYALFRVQAQLVWHYDLFSRISVAEWKRKKFGHVKSGFYADLTGSINKNPQSDFA